ncbi:hypothetical protein [Desulforamulus hydrothermalis]|uniref:Lipoprotein n=1 Tax=Desulforamulus hydrothermalis Lam5 = DSM 18033 TaxID=1121428 RepID=K8E663_9FIRM|nr:hypothetical protein [Desulforamulus hydrothermalis]CCO06928.1 conserved exported hypothetical protein [Desulforamulus hydrothermalis Lam5 = DSM 18033]SHG99317.1 hypothetical protein SAMN02745177_01059 [Desulforamulus hydrothermalis Lam5 = DSM 18033]
MKQKVAFWTMPLVLAGLFLFVLAGCGKSTETVKQGEMTTKYSTEIKKGVELPADYPKDKFPVYKDAYVMSVQTMDKSYILVCFSQNSIQEVAAFYKELLKDSQIISQTDRADEYTVMGVKDGYTYTFCVTKNSQQDKELKDFPTSLSVSLVPAPEGMAESLKEMSGSMPGGKK